MEFGDQKKTQDKSVGIPREERFVDEVLELLLPFPISSILHKLLVLVVTILNFVEIVVFLAVIRLAQITQTAAIEWLSSSFPN